MSEKNMPFLAHLGELRRHILRALVGVVLASVIIAAFWDKVLKNLFLPPLSSDFATYKIFNKALEFFGLNPAFDQSFSIETHMQNVTPMGQLTAQMIAVISLGIIVAMPYVVFEIWRFIKPALKPSEKKHFYSFFVFTSLFFAVGVLFSYFVILPLSIQFFFFYTPFDVPNRWHLSNYIKLFSQTLLGFGVVFLFPIVVYFLARIELIGKEFLGQYRKQAFVLILVLAAVITPSDPFTMLIAAMPLMLLYEFSVLVVKIVYKRKGTSTELIKP